MQERENPFSGENLDKYAKERLGLTRKPGETDDQLLRRCMVADVERCYGAEAVNISAATSWLFTQNEGERENG